jgi:hypothetical protein
MSYRFWIIYILVIIPSAAFAQLDLVGLTNQETTITLNPAFPSPGELVTASLDDYSGGVYGAQIDWAYNGQLIENATNQRQVQFIAGAAGTDITIEAALDIPQGNTQYIREIISPIFMDIIIEPQTRTPDWYRGRSLPSLGAQVNATILLNDGSFIDPTTVVYTWRLNKKVLQNGPVRGGNQMSFITPRGNSMVLSVIATKLNGEVIASRAVSVNSVLPELNFYEKHTLYGMKETPTLTSSNLIGSVLTLQAEPFFLDTQVYNNPDVALWEINRIKTDNNTQNPYEITLQRTGTNGQTAINFHVRSLQEVLQGAEERIAINF